MKGNIARTPWIPVGVHTCAICSDAVVRDGTARKEKEEEGGGGGGGGGEESEFETTMQQMNTQGRSAVPIVTLPTNRNTAMHLWVGIINT